MITYACPARVRCRFTDKFTSIALAGAGACWLPTLALAQQSDAPPATTASEPTAGIAEIVVTAQKRAEKSQKVPIAISAIGAATLRDTGFQNLGDLSRLTPSLQLSNFGPIAFITARGIGNENTTAGGDPGVAIHYDGVYLGRPVGALFSAFDTERVEVLRGPQGTLYGRNATGGSINYITVKPQKEFGGEADFTAGNYDWYRGRLALNVPLNDEVQARIVGFAEKRQGFTANSVPGGTRANDADNWGVRGHLLYQPTRDLSILLSSSYVKSGGVGSHPELRTPFPGARTGQNTASPPIPGTNNYSVGGIPLVNDLRPFREGKEFPESQDNYLWVSSATIDWDLGPVAVKSITGYVRTKFDNRSDNDASPKNLFNLFLTENSEAESQELQLVSTTAQRFKWIAGAYFFHEDATRDSRFFGPVSEIIAAANNVESGFEVGGTITSRSYAFFGQGTYQLTPKLSFTGGLRYTNDLKYGTNIGFTFRPPFYRAPVRGAWDKVTYRLVADWQATSNALFYASFTTGYRSGGVNQQINANVENAIYNPETVKAVEIGAKTRLLDGKLQFNTSLYYNQYDDLQFQIFGLLGPAAFNAKGAKVKGIEVEIQALPFSWLRVDASGAYTDGKFDRQVIDGVQLDGKRVQRTPEFKANIGTTATKKLASGAEARLRVDYSYTGSIYYTPFNRNAGFDQPGGSDFARYYDNVDIRAFYTLPGGRWTFEAFATNLFDTTQTGNVFRNIGFTDVPTGGGAELVSYNPPRQFGGRVGIKF